ncbi:MAG: phosphodiesterase [Candidatus Adiutrix sp.]|jgi:putative phosphoesterase|nr:phosphodiesterase [Candidatus Adiutrix sp.]
MRLLIASDIHGSLGQGRLIGEKVREHQAGQVLLLGDLLYHGPRNPLPADYAPGELAGLLSDLGAPLMAIRGNCDAEVDQFVLPFHLAESAWIFDGSRRILAIHGHQLAINGGPLPAPEGVAVLSGHSHVPTAEKRGRTHFWNPGSSALPKESFPPSYGFYQDGRFRVLDFNGQELMSDSF